MNPCWRWTLHLNVFVPTNITFALPLLSAMMTSGELARLLHADIACNLRRHARNTRVVAGKRPDDRDSCLCDTCVLICGVRGADAVDDDCIRLRVGLRC